LLFFRGFLRNHFKKTKTEKMEDPIRNCVNTALAKGFLHSFEDLFNIAHNSSTLETEQLLSVNETLLEAESAFNLGK